MCQPLYTKQNTQTPSPGVLLLPLPLPSDAQASPELPGRLGLALPGPPSSSPDCHAASVLGLAQGRPLPLTAGVQGGYVLVKSRPIQTGSHGREPWPHGRKTLGDCSRLQPHRRQSGLLEEGVGEARARGQAASRFLRHLGELMASLLAGVIWPNLPAVPVCPARLGPAASPFES